MQAAAQDIDVLDLVKECDVLAAHPQDPQRVSEGVADDRIIPRLAIRACEGAVSEDATEPRFVFQLGRALLAARRKTESAAAFRKAASAGHAAGWAYLGDALQFGHGGAINYEQAREAYKKARDGGFEPAGELVDQLVFLPDMYANVGSVGILEQLYSEKFDALGASVRGGGQKWAARSYLFSLTQKLINECDGVINSRNVVLLHTFRYGAGWSADIEAQPAIGIFHAVGEHDGRVFLKRHGCEGGIAKHVFRAIARFLSDFKEL